MIMTPVTGKLQCKKRDLNLEMMLEGGQCFRWLKTAPSKWTGVFSSHVWTLVQKDDCIDFQAVSSLASPLESKKLASLLSDYLRLDEPVSAMYKNWCSSDPHFEATVGHARGFEGIRILNQDPVENLFSFICSSNNNIKRISSMVNNMCSLFGPKIADLDGISYHDFPDVESLVGETVEGSLRKAGFGYRAGFVDRAARQVVELGGRSWLESLKKLPYSEAKAALMQLHGVGAKVADCICLMSLGHMGAVPVDTHVFQIACRHYTPHLSRAKTVTDRVYNEIGDFFRKLYGEHAGWAHTVLFCADLKMFREKPSQKPKDGRKRKQNGSTDSETELKPPVEKPKRRVLRMN